MSLPVQISLNKKRLSQLEEIRNSRDSFKKMMLDDVAKALLFEKIDESCVASAPAAGRW